MTPIKVIQTSIDIAEVQGTTREERERLYEAIEELINKYPNFKCLNSYWPAEDLTNQYNQVDVQKYF